MVSKRDIKVILLHCRARPYCARFSRHLRAYESMRVQNLRDFPEVKLDSEIDDCFLLNEQGDPHFLKYEFKLHKITSIWLDLKKNFKFCLKIF